ncbi:MULTISPECIES: porin [Myroides]|uniref:Phosphate-selective porin O and P n=1 Tax=Myroides albus TaxID=2562892 RepID=A0A6I3LMU3_9FLAO|nr:MULTISPECIES: porin [Myroides]MTG98640.1 hypothetical protein [Myroides albus]MVX34630.1 hypothetical protein [Myroides sp. LoEW2-1]UVD79203.1 OprO/OprP family phosphate-selective porin [Myroides albus]
MKVKLMVGALLVSHLSLFAQQSQPGNLEKTSQSNTGEHQTLLELVLPELGTNKEPQKVKNSSFNAFLDSRYENYTKVKGSETTDSRFRLQQSRVYVKANYQDKFSFSMRYRLNESVASNALEFAYLEYNPNEHWTLSIGKQFIAWGSMEFSYNGSDQYMYTNMLGSMDLFAPGASIAYKTSGQSFKLQGISAGTQYVDLKYKDKAYGGLFLWEGNLFNNHLQTRYGYGLMQHNSNRYYNWVTLGNRVSVDKWMMELDWMYGYRNVKDAQLDLIQHKENTTYVKDNTTTMTLRYKFNKVSPFVKAMYNYRDDLDANIAYAQKGIMGAIEYYPFEEKLFKDLRLFAVYSYIDYDYKKVQQKPKDNDEHQLYIGVRWMIPLF